MVVRYFYVLFLKVNKTWISPANNVSSRKGLVINYKSPGGMDINHEDGVGDGIVVMTVQRGNRRKEHTGQRRGESCFIKTTEKT